MAKSLKGFAKQIDGIAQHIARQKDRIEVAALQAGYVHMMRRIFGAGKDGGGYAIDGSSLGEYSDSYRALRTRKGRGLNLTKNLVFHGDLKESVQQGKKGNKNVIGFTNNELAKIAEYQETSDKQVNKPIFGFNEFENEEVNEVLEKELREVIRQSLKDV